MTHKPRLLWNGILPAFALIASDQALKRWVNGGTFPMLKRYDIFGQKQLVLARFHNRGLMADRFSAIPDGYIEPYTQYMPAVCLLALMIAVGLRWKTAGKCERLSAALLIAGGISNLWDHVRQGYVVDALQLLTFNGVYLPFNLADAGIVGGAMVLVARLLIDLRESVRMGKALTVSPS